MFTSSSVAVERMPYFEGGFFFPVLILRDCDPCSIGATCFPVVTCFSTDPIVGMTFFSFTLVFGMGCG